MFHKGPESICLGFAGQPVTTAGTPLCSCSWEAATGSSWTNGQGCVSWKLMTKHPGTGKSYFRARLELRIGPSKGKQAMRSTPQAKEPL